MTARVDTFTSTVDGAAAFERHHNAHEPYDDRPSLSDLYEGEEEPDDWMRAVMEDGPPEPDPGPVERLYGGPQVEDRECRSAHHRELRLTGNGTDRCDECWAEAPAAWECA